MESKISILKKIVEYQEEIRKLGEKLRDSNYWINKAKEEVGFEPQEGDWISIEIKLWRITVYVYHKHGHEGAKYWINGQWFNTSFPEKCPLNTNILTI